MTGADEQLAPAPHSETRAPAMRYNAEHESTPVPR